MINKIACCILLTASLALTGCVGPEQTSEHYSPPSSVDGQLCADECTKSKAHCMALCATPDPRYHGGCGCEQEYHVCYQMCGTRTTTYH